MAKVTSSVQLLSGDGMVWENERGFSRSPKDGTWFGRMTQASADLLEMGHGLGE